VAAGEVLPLGLAVFDERIAGALAGLKEISEGCIASS
jgi:hypothetical protein